MPGAEGIEGEGPGESDRDGSGTQLEGADLAFAVFASGYRCRLAATRSTMTCNAPSAIAHTTRSIGLPDSRPRVNLLEDSSPPRELKWGRFRLPSNHADGGGVLLGNDACGLMQLAMYARRRGVGHTFRRGAQLSTLPRSSFESASCPFPFPRLCLLPQ
mgnify:CR=1 FL=1